MFTVPLYARSSAPISYSVPAACNDRVKSCLPRISDVMQLGSTAIVYCEANFGAIDGKTANGLVRRSERYKILSVIDSEKTGLDAGNGA